MNTSTPTPAPVTNVMLDIETYGLTPGSVIKSIGAVKFGICPKTGEHEITDRFYHRIDAQSCVRAGLTLDAATVEWWLAQSDDARGEMTKPGEPLVYVLQSFEFWLGRVEAANLEIWGNGAPFDNVLLQSAYKAGNVPACWTNMQSRCYRTVKNANKDLPIDPYRLRTHHNALDDAESQALHLMAIWARDARRRRAVALLAKAVQSANGVAQLEGVQNILSPEALIALDNWMSDARAILLD